jgi:hypothetical protein
MEDVVSDLMPEARFCHIWQSSKQSKQVGGMTPMLFCAFPMIDRCIFLSRSIIASQSITFLFTEIAQLCHLVSAWSLSVDPAR